MKEDLSVVMEVGNFDELDIDDPTKKKVKKDVDELEELINESIEANKSISI